MDVERLSYGTFCVTIVLVLAAGGLYFCSLPLFEGSTDAHWTDVPLDVAIVGAGIASLVSAVSGAVALKRRRSCPWVLGSAIIFVFCGMSAAVRVALVF